MAYTTINKPSEYFNTVLYTGTGSTQSITGVGFQPDLVWCKDRTNSYDQVWFDAVRGATKRITSNTTSAETTASTDLTSFDSDGFSVGSGSNINNNGNNFVSWNWKANGAGVSNTDGSITSTVSASTTSGFSIVKYTGTGANATVGHGLGVAPKLIITKSLVASQEWCVGSDMLGWGNYLFLNETSASQSGSVYWQSTAPTSTVFSVGTAGPTNSSSAMIAYCFAEKKGFSRFGSYLGSGSAAYASFVYCGFKPAFVLIKRAIGGVDSWFINDTARATYNPSQQYMRPNEASAEGTSSAHQIDILSNGFKIRSSDTAYNTLNDTYIYMAFAEQPLVGSNGVPATTR